MIIQYHELLRAVAISFQNICFLLLKIVLLTSQLCNLEVSKQMCERNTEQRCEQRASQKLTSIKSYMPFVMLRKQAKAMRYDRIQLPFS